MNFESVGSGVFEKTSLENVEEDGVWLSYKLPRLMGLEAQRILGTSYEKRNSSLMNCSNTDKTEVMILNKHNIN